LRTSDAGELLKQIEPATGKNNQYAQVKEVGDQPFHSRQEAAADAGMSPHEAKQAVRVANIPAEEFEHTLAGFSLRPPNYRDRFDTIRSDHHATDA
jgi:methylphosphotriester-DNA--protein-cysteine methyltransferase